MNFRLGEQGFKLLNVPLDGAVDMIDNMPGHIIYCCLAAEIGLKIIVKRSMCYAWLCSNRLLSKAPLMPLSDNHQWRSLSRSF